jgi:hypothetical protein
MMNLMENCSLLLGQKRAVALLSGKKVTMPNTLNALSDGSIHSIRENASPVKPKLQNVT